MAKLLINVTHGPEHPTRAALGSSLRRRLSTVGTR
jgi:hypothetical protein